MRSAVQHLHDACEFAQRSLELAVLARESLIAEAELTPKPGLVDRRGSGAHSDLTLDLMRRSAFALEPFFAAMASVSEGRIPDRELREELALIGQDAEHAMFQATRGANSHKGAIWILGLLVAGAARNQGQSAAEIAEGAAAIARYPHRPGPELVTHGEIVRRRYGVDGARGEAMQAFPHVTSPGMPMLRKQRDSGRCEHICRLDALCAIMSELDDTCVLYRGGRSGLAVIKARARAVLAAGGYGSVSGRKEAQRLDSELSARRLSPGGSADLLAATIFLDVVDRQEQEVCKDQSEWEATGGKS